MNNYNKVMPRIISIATTLFKHVFVALAYFVIQFLFFFFTSNYAHTALEVQFWNSFILIVVLGVFNAAVIMTAPEFASAGLWMM